MTILRNLSYPVDLRLKVSNDIKLIYICMLRYSTWEFKEIIGHYKHTLATLLPPAYFWVGPCFAIEVNRTHQGMGFTRPLKVCDMKPSVSDAFTSCKFQVGAFHGSDWLFQHFPKILDWPEVNSTPPIYCCVPRPILESFLQASMARCHCHQEKKVSLKGCIWPWG